jgi:hypothetical protein
MSRPRRKVFWLLQVGEQGSDVTPQSLRPPRVRNQLPISHRKELGPGEYPGPCLILIYIFSIRD